MSFFVSKEIEDKICENNLYDDNVVYVSYDKKSILSGVVSKAKRNKITIKMSDNISSEIFRLILIGVKCELVYNDIILAGNIYSYKSCKNNKYIVFKIEE